MGSAATLFAALPLGNGPLGWLAPLGWLLLIRRPTLDDLQLPPDREHGAMPKLPQPRLERWWRAFAGLVRGTMRTARGPYAVLYLSGFLFWMLTLHWLRLPHWATNFGWVALSAYLAVYTPLFVGLSRVAVHRWGAPLWLAVPVVWTALELARGHVLGGFSMCNLAHTQYAWITLIQICDWPAPMG